MVGECADLVRTVAPHLDAVRVERVWSAGGVVRIAARTRELTVACPDCGRGSTRVHSRYCRTLADAAVGGRPVLIRLSVRRLFCDAPGCGRRTFAEQVEGLAVGYQRRSPLLQQLVEMAGVYWPARDGRNARARGRRRPAQSVPGRGDQYAEVRGVQGGRSRGTGPRRTGVGYLPATSRCRSPSACALPLTREPSSCS
ncbi:transposase family protein [Streptomyces sp. MCAF7]